MRRRTRRKSNLSATKIPPGNLPRPESPKNNRKPAPKTVVPVNGRRNPPRRENNHSKNSNPKAADRTKTRKSASADGEGKNPVGTGRAHEGQMSNGATEALSDPCAGHSVALQVLFRIEFKQVLVRRHQISIMISVAELDRRNLLKT